jgi:hypothetical protein
MRPLKKHEEMNISGHCTQFGLERNGYQRVKGTYPFMLKIYPEVSGSISLFIRKVDIHLSDRD